MPGSLQRTRSSAWRRGAAPTSRASPSIASPSTTGAHRRATRPPRRPRARASVAVTRTVSLARDRSADRRAWESRWERRGRRARRRAGDEHALGGGRRRTGRAPRARPRSVVGSATVGPEPITDGSSPGTSETIRVTTRAGQARRRQAAALDRRQVLAHAVDLADRRAAAQQRAPICRSSASVDARRRQAEQRRAAAGDQAEDEIVGAEAARPRDDALPPRARPASSGTGWAASTTSMRSQGTAWP